MNTAALIQLGLTLLPTVETGVEYFVKWIAEMRTSLQQTGEWTDAQEKAFNDALWAKTQDSAYRPDPPA